MKLIEKILYIQFNDFIQAGWKEDTVKKANFRNGPFWQMIPDPEDRRMVLVQYDTLREKDQKKLTGHFGDPYQYIAKAPIKKLVQPDFKADEFFTTYRYDDNQSLKQEYINKYKTAAAWLNMIIKCQDDKKIIKKELNLKLEDFYTHVTEIIAAENIALPTSHKRLIYADDSAVKRYRKDGYATLIDWRFGNSNGIKVKDELSESVLFEMIGHANQYDDVFIVWNYNNWAKKNDRKEITAGTVGNYRRRYYDMLVMQREGNEAYINKYGKSIKGFRPSHPTYFIESDDNHTDYYFVNWEDKTQHKYYYTFKAVFVTDSYNDLVLGYAVGKEITIELVKEAYRNAMHYMKKLTGCWVLPHETKSDRWGLKTLHPFYESIGHYAPTPKGSKKRGYLEQFFGSTHWSRCMKVGAVNYTGHNVTAKTTGVNREALVANRDNYPTIQEAPQYFADLVARLRRMPPKEGALSKEAEWLKAWNEMPADKKRIIGDEQFLLKFGIEKAKPNTITSKGLDLQINNKKYNYDIPDEYYYQYKGCTLHTLIDPNDMSRVLVTDHKNIRFIATAPHLQSRAMADYKEGDRQRLNTLLNGKKAHVEKASAWIEGHKNTLNEGGICIDKLLTESFLLKEERIAAVEDYQYRQLPEPEERRVINPIDKM